MGGYFTPELKCWYNNSCRTVGFVDILFWWNMSKPYLGWPYKSGGYFLWMVVSWVRPLVIKPDWFGGKSHFTHNPHATKNGSYKQSGVHCWVATLMKKPSIWLPFEPGQVYCFFCIADFLCAFREWLRKAFCCPWNANWCGGCAKPNSAKDGCERCHCWEVPER